MWAPQLRYLFKGLYNMRKTCSTFMCTIRTQMKLTYGMFEGDFEIVKIIFFFFFFFVWNHFWTTSLKAEFSLHVFFTYQNSLVSLSVKGKGMIHFHFWLLSELTMWRECYNRRSNIYYLSCNSSLSAQEGEVWTKWKKTWCFVHRKVHLEFVSWKFVRKILIPLEGREAVESHLNVVS